MVATDVMARGIDFERVNLYSIMIWLKTLINIYIELIELAVLVPKVWVSVSLPMTMKKIKKLWIK